MALTLYSTSYCHGQSPWVAGKGGGYAQVMHTYIPPHLSLFSNQPGGHHALAREVIDASLNVYGEWGIDSRTSALLTLPIKFINVGRRNPTFQSIILIEKGTLSALGNVQIGVRRNFIEKKMVFSGQLLAEFPSSSFDEKTGIRTGLNAFSFIPSISVGRGWSRWYGYVFVGTAIRTGDYSSDFRSGIEIGYRFFKKIYAVGVLEYRTSFNNGTVMEHIHQQQTGLYLNNQEFLSYGGKIIATIIKGWGIIGAFQGAFFGNRVAQTYSLNLGMFYQWPSKNTIEENH